MIDPENVLRLIRAKRLQSLGAKSQKSHLAFVPFHPIETACGHFCLR